MGGERGHLRRGKRERAEAKRPRGGRGRLYGGGGIQYRTLMKPKGESFEKTQGGGEPGFGMNLGSKENRWVESARGAIRVRHRAAARKGVLRGAARRSMNDRLRQREVQAKRGGRNPSLEKKGEGSRIGPDLKSKKVAEEASE